MTTTARPPSQKQHDRQVMRELTRDRRTARLPLTFLGTYDDRKQPEEQGWQQHMWSHHAFVIGCVQVAAVAVNQAVEHGILESAAWTSAGAAGAGLFCAAGGLIATAGEKFHDWARAYFISTPLAAGTYLAAVAHTSPFSTGSLAAVAAGTAIGMGMYYKMRTSQDDKELAYVARFAAMSPPPAAKKQPAQQVPAAPVYEQLDPQLRGWDHAFAEVGLKGCRAKKKIDTLAGYAILVDLPSSGRISAEQVGEKLGNLERNMKLTKDSLEFDTAVDTEGRELSHRCWIIVDVENILEQLLLMPGDHDDQEHTPTTIKEAFRIGTFMDGTPMTLRFREISALIVGVRGRGKTNLFHVIVHQLSRCVDALLWAVDLKGGRAVKPWLRPWLEERAPRPIFDWVATTRAEATLMVHAAKALIDFRGNASAGGSKIEPSAEHPAVLLLVDEFAALAGAHAGPKLANKNKDWWRNPSASQIGATVTLVVQLGRSEAVDAVFFTQRSTVTMAGGGDLKSQCEMRIGLGVTNPQDATSVFQNNNIAAKKLRKLKNKRTRGACLIENGETNNHLAGKTFFYGDDDPDNLPEGSTMTMTERIDRTATLHAMFPADLPLIEQQAVHEALLELTGGECGYGVGPYAAGDERWSLARAEHLYSDTAEPEWVDDDPGNDELLGGRVAPVSGAPTSGAGTSTLTRPRAVRPTSGPPAGPARPGPIAPTYNRQADIPTSPGHPPVGDVPTSGPERYYKRRADRTPSGGGEPAAPKDPNQLDPEARHYQDEFNAMVEFLETTPDAEEPVYDTGDPAQLTKFELMLEIIKAAGATGVMPGDITKKMVEQGNSWSQRSQLYPALRKAEKANKIVQPWERGPYYWHEYAPPRAS